MPKLKYAKYVVSEDLLRLTEHGKRMALTLSKKKADKPKKKGMLGDSTHMLSMEDGIIKGAFYFDTVWLWGKRDDGGKKPKAEQHAHDFDEILAFMGSRKENPQDLNAEIEFWIEDEKYVITKSTVIFIPRGVRHLPMECKRIDSPVLFITTGTGTAYKATEYEMPKKSKKSSTSG
jgi:hypothetical protein